MTPILQTHGLSKHFGDFKAVNDLTITVNRGEIYGFLGPNGAGKTTTILMILGLLRPTSGSLSLLGQPSADNETRRRIGVALEHLSFYDEMTALEYLRFFGDIYNVPSIDERAQDLLTLLNLSEWKDGVISSFSTGMRRKLALARALLHRPELLILDEPTSGLDPLSLVQVRQLLLDARNEGTTVVVSSHQLSEVEQSADRVAIIAKGQLVAEDTVKTLLQRTQSASATLTIELAEVADSLVSKLREQPYVDQVTQHGNTLRVVPAGPDDIRADLSRFMADEGALILEMTVQQETSTLEQVFVALTSAAGKND
jgi:ABC-2 type transport system ATP-binding protein